MKLTSSSPPIAEFLLEIDGLKLIERRSYIVGGSRRENSGEHSWHVALAAWAFANYLGKNISLEKLLKLALVHDLGELDAGDTFLYSSDRDESSKAEADCVSRLADRHPVMLPDLEELWAEQQLGETAEARLLKVADRFLPFLHNISNKGRTWIENDIAKSQVLGAHAFIASEAPELFAWMEEQLDIAVTCGWLRDA